MYETDKSLEKLQKLVAMIGQQLKLAMKSSDDEQIFKLMRKINKVNFRPLVEHTAGENFFCLFLNYGCHLPTFYNKISYDMLLRQYSNMPKETLLHGLIYYYFFSVKFFYSFCFFHLYISIYFFEFNHYCYL